MCQKLQINPKSKFVALINRKSNARIIKILLAYLFFITQKKLKNKRYNKISASAPKKMKLKKKATKSTLVQYTMQSAFCVSSS